MSAPAPAAECVTNPSIDDLLTKSEDVGKAFPTEARKIFYKESPARAIRGQATNEEHQDLVDEGIPVARLPFPPTDKLN